MVRKMNPQEALDVLRFTNKSAAEPLMKAIKTTMANAGKDSGLVFKAIEINEGMKLKRYRAGTAGRGRGRPYKRRWSHIKIVLTDEVISDKKQETSKGKEEAKRIKNSVERVVEKTK